jgi:tetratricopeptide (TPR) repeat protein
MDNTISLENTAGESNGQTEFSGGLRNFPPELRALFEVIGQHLTIAGQFEQARVVYMALLNMDAANPGYLIGAATALQGENKLGQAAVFYNLALSMGSKDPAIALRVAECRRALQDEARAEEALDMAERLARASTDVNVSGLLERIAMMRKRDGV